MVGVEGVGTEFVAREDELTAALAAVRTGNGAIVMGEAGVGKTSLAQMVADRTRADGGNVMWTVATEASRNIPFGALAVLVPDDVTSFHPVLAIGLFGRRLRALGGGQPALLVVDDAQLLDDQSAVTLLGLVCTGAAKALVTVRSGEVAPDPVTTLWKDGFLTSVELDPLDRDATQRLLLQSLGGDVSAATVERLWQWTRGNPLYLRELVRHGRAEGTFLDVGGLWMWQGDLRVPPRLADLLERRFDGMSAEAVDVLCALVMAQPLSLEILAKIAPADAVGEIERRALVEAEERDGSVWLSVAHPLIAAAAGRMLTPMRRRRLADSLVAASSGRRDVSRQASWLLDASQAPDVAGLVAASREVLLTNPTLAARFAERAVAYDVTPAAAVALSDANAELGRADAAWDAYRTAAARATTDEDRLSVYLTEIALTTWTERKPRAALDRISELRVGADERLSVELDSVEALTTLFSARPADALALADKVLAASPPQAARLRALMVRLGALTLVGRRREATEAAAVLLRLTDAPGTGPYTVALAHAMAAIGRVPDLDTPVPSTYMSFGRWPVVRSAGEQRDTDLMVWPLSMGARLLFAGEPAAAVGHLREAVVEQRVGEGLFRSESVSLLIVGLAALGQVEEAEQLLTDEPPDDVGLYPGLLGWVRGVVTAARGRPGGAEMCLGAAEQAWEVGGIVTALAHLHAAARLGAADQASRLLDEWAIDIEPPTTQARAVAIHARASGDGKALLDAAEQHAAIGFCGDALELARLASAALSRDASGASQRAGLLIQQMRSRLQLPAPRFEPVVGLTRRELEVARLAGRGMADRDVAETLFLSVRTVESHLASAYRKLGITSRRQLGDVLAEMT